MLAIRSRNDEVDEEERVPLTTYTDTSLFEGLSFPEVPKTSIRRNTNIADPLSYSTSYQYQSASQDDNDMEMIELADLPSAPLLSTSIQLEDYDITMPKEKPSASSAYVLDSKVPTVKGSLSTLYASAEVSTEHASNLLH